MKPAFSLNSYLLAILIPFVVFLTAVLLTFTETVKLHPEVYSGVTYDLVLTTPIFAYFLSKRRLPKWAMSLLVLAGIVTAWFIIPKEHHQHLNYIRFLILPLVELFVLGSVIYFVYKTIRTLRDNQDYLTAIIESTKKATGSKRAGIFLGTEFSMLFYALFTWKKPHFEIGDFTSHHTSGIKAVYGGVLMILAAESIGMHFIVARWSELLAWILTFLSIYSMLLLFGWIKASLRRSVSVSSDAITIRNGLAPAFNIPLSAIDRIEASEKTPENRNGLYRQALLGEMEPHTIIVYFKEPISCTMIYGKKKLCQAALLHIDNKQDFLELVRNRITQHETV